MPFSNLLSAIVDNRGRTCPVGNSGMPLIATNCIDPNSLYPHYDTTRFVSDEVYQTWFRGHPKAGDILFVCKGSPGRTNWVPDPVDFCIAQDMVSVRANPKIIYPKYLFAALRSPIVQAQIENMHVGTMIPHFKKGDFDKLNIPVPSTAEQHVIGDLYFSISERITLLRETNATLEAIAQAIFKSWFVDFEPVRAKMEGRAPEGMDEATAALFPDSFEESELGLVPKGWRVGSLEDVATLNPESWTAKKHPETVLYIDLANVKNNQISEIINYGFNVAPSRARRVLRDGDTIVGTVRPGNRSFAFIYEAVPTLTASTGFAVLRPRAIENTEFIYLAATQDSSIEHLAHIADGGAYPAVRPDAISGIQTVLPSNTQMVAFHEIAASLLASIAQNQQQAQTLANLRDTLLPRLISGKLRLPEAENTIAEAIA